MFEIIERRNETDVTERAEKSVNGRQLNDQIFHDFLGIGVDLFLVRVIVLDCLVISDGGGLVPIVVWSPLAFRNQIKCCIRGRKEMRRTYDL